MTTSGRRKYDLSQSPLYKLSSKKKLASLLHLSSVQELIVLTRLKNGYRKFDVSIKNKLRPVEVPSRALFPIHARLFSLLQRVELPDYLHSGVKGRSYITNAQAHLEAKKTCTTDIARFYPSVHRAKVFSFFRDTMKCSADVAAIVSQLTTCDNHIPTGSSLSQLLAYMACKNMFDEIHGVCTRDSVVMTCYVDDLTFSGDVASRAWLYKKIKPIILKYGLRAHKDKFFGPAQPKEITGVVVDKGKIKVCNRLHKSIHELTMQILNTNDSVDLDNIYNTLIGKLSAAAQIDKKFIERRRQVVRKRRLLLSRNNA